MGVVVEDGLKPMMSEDEGLLSTSRRHGHLFLGIG